MFDIRESDLPGIGRKVQIETNNGDKIVVVIHDDGKREIFQFNPNDPDESIAVMTLDDDEARKFAGVVGGMTYTPKALQTLEVDLDDLVIDWYKVPEGAKSAGKTIGELQLRQKTGASIIAIVEPDKRKRLNPGPSEVIQEHATLVVTGAREHVRTLKQLIAHGS